MVLRHYVLQHRHSTKIGVVPQHLAAPYGSTKIGQVLQHLSRPRVCES